MEAALYHYAETYSALAIAWFQNEIEPLLAHEAMIGESPKGPS